MATGESTQAHVIPHEEVRDTIEAYEAARAAGSPELPAAERALIAILPSNGHQVIWHPNRTAYGAWCGELMRTKLGWSAW